MTKNLEKLYLATRTLVGPGPIKQRLVEAFEVNLEDLDMGELPEPINNEFKNHSKRNFKSTSNCTSNKYSSFLPLYAFNNPLDIISKIASFS